MEIPLEVGISPTLGIRGLLATRDLQPGEVIECCPVVLFPVNQGDLLEQTALGNYYFLWDDDSLAVAFGYGSLYNHAYHANVRYERDFERQNIVFKAAKAIRCGEEMTINYNGAPDDETLLDPALWW